MIQIGIVTFASTLESIAVEFMRPLRYSHSMQKCKPVSEFLAIFIRGS